MKARKTTDLTSQHQNICVIQFNQSFPPQVNLTSSFGLSLSTTSNSFPTPPSPPSLPLSQSLNFSFHELFLLLYIYETHTLLNVLIASYKILHDLSPPRVKESHEGASAHSWLLGARTFPVSQLQAPTTTRTQAHQ